MPYFTDTKGRSWNVRITPYAMREVKDFAGINLGTILQDGMKPLAELLSDPADFCSVLYAICKDDADGKGIDLRDFMEGIVGDPMEQAAGAFLEALQQCFPTSQSMLIQAVRTMIQHDEKKTKKKVETLLKELTFISTRSRWQRLLAWIRGTTPVTS